MQQAGEVGGGELAAVADTGVADVGLRHRTQVRVAVEGFYQIGTTLWEPLSKPTRVRRE